MANRYLITGGSSVVWTAADTSLWSTASGGATGASVPVDGDAVIFDGSSGGGTVTLGYSPTVTSITMGAFTGTFDASTFSPTMDTFSGSGTGVRTLNMGSGAWTIRGNAATVFTITTVTNLTLVAGNETINFTYAGSTGTRVVQMNGTVGRFGNINITAGSDTFQWSSASSSITSLDFTGFTGTYSAGVSLNILGDYTLGAGMTVLSTASSHTLSATTSRSIRTNGVQVNYPITLNGVGGSWTLQDSLNMDGATPRALTLTNGTFNANGFNVTCGSVAATNSNIRTLTMGTGTWTLTGTAIVFNLGTSTNLTLSSNLCTILITDTSASSKTMSLGVVTKGINYGTITVTPGGSGAVVFTAGATMTIANLNCTGPKTLNFTAARTYVVTNLNLTGTAGNLVTLASSTPGSQYTLSVASGDVYARYVSLQDSNATGGARFFALNSTNVSNNTGWNFVASRTAASGRFNIRDQHAAIAFDGSTSFLAKASPTGINNGTNGSVTISAWVRLDQSDLCTVAELHVNGGTSPSFGIGQSGGQYVVFSDRVNGGNNKVIAKATFDTYIGLNRWVMLTYVLTSADITIYAGTTAIIPTSSFGTAINAGTVSNLFIGKGQTVGQADIQFLKGGVKDVRIYNAALTATEVSNLYYSQIDSTTPSAAWQMDEGAGASIVTSVGSNNLTATGITWTSNRPFAARKRDDGNLVKNGGFEYAPPFTAATTTITRWIDGTASGSTTNDLFGWAMETQGSAGSYAARFDTSNVHAGTYAMKVSTTATASNAVVRPVLNSGNALGVLKYSIPAQASTSYTVSFWMQTVANSGSATSGAFLRISEVNAAGTVIVNNDSTKIQATTGLTQYTITFTTNAVTAFLLPQLSVIGNDGTATLIMDAWFDDITLTATTPQVRAAASGRVAIS